MLNSKAASIQPPWQMAWYLLWLSKLAGGSVLTTSTPGLHLHLAEMRQTVNHFQAVKGPDHMLDGASWRLCIQHCCCTAAFLTVRVCQETDSYVRKLFGRTNCDNSNSCSLLAVSVVTITFQVHQLPWRQCYCWSSHLRHYAVSFNPVQIHQLLFIPRREEVWKNCNIGISPQVCTATHIHLVCWSGGKTCFILIES